MGIGGIGQGHKAHGGGSPSGSSGLSYGAGSSGVVASAIPQSAGQSGIVAGAPSKERHGAIILDRNRQNGKRLARILVSAGYSVKTDEEETPHSLWAAISSEPEMASWLLCGEAASAGVLCGILARPEARRHCRGIIYYGSKDPAAAATGAEEPDVAALCEQPGLVAVLGVRSAQTRDLETELLGVATYLRGQALMPLQAFLLWGAAAYSTAIHNVSGRDAAEARIVKLCSEQLSVGSRIANSVGEVVHELLTNAMYDAPVDENGRAIYAHDRTAPIELRGDDRVIFRYGTDGLRLVVETVDRFGRLRRGDLVRSMRRAASGQVNRAVGGAGIGLSMIYKTAQAVQFDVEPGTRTRVTAVFDLDGARSADASRSARSLIFPDLTMASGRRDP
jgi:hypothetical protein